MTMLTLQQAQAMLPGSRLVGDGDVAFDRVHTDTRSVRKADMRLNGYTPTIEVDPENYRVRADGLLLTCEPAPVLPLAQRYFLF